MCANSKHVELEKSSDENRAHKLDIIINDIAFR